MHKKLLASVALLGLWPAWPMPNAASQSKSQPRLPVAPPQPRSPAAAPAPAAAAPPAAAAAPSPVRRRPRPSTPPALTRRCIAAPQRRSTMRSARYRAVLGPCQQHRSGGHLSGGCAAPARPGGGAGRQTPGNCSARRGCAAIRQDRARPGGAGTCGNAAARPRHRRRPRPTSPTATAVHSRHRRGPPGAWRWRFPKAEQWVKQAMSGSKRAVGRDGRRRFPGVP